jgi:hypothetical protein
MVHPMVLPHLSGPVVPGFSLWSSARQMLLRMVLGPAYSEPCMDSRASAVRMTP